MSSINYAGDSRNSNAFSLIYEYGYRVSYLTGEWLAEFFYAALRNNALFLLKIAQWFEGALRVCGHGLKKGKYAVLDRPLFLLKENYARSTAALKKPARKRFFPVLAYGAAAAACFCWANLVLLWRKKSLLYPLAALAVFVAVLLVVSSLTLALSVEYNGQHLGYVENEAQLNSAKAMVQERIMPDSAGNLTDIQPKISLTVVRSDDISTQKDLTNAILAASGDEIVQAVGVYVGGTFLGAYTDTAAVVNAFDSVKAPYKTDNPTDRTEFVQSVKITDGLFPTTSVKDVGELDATLHSNKVNDVYYTTVAGDSASLIAQKNDMTMDQLLALNPNIDKKLFVGQQVLVTKSEPFLKVQTTKLVTYNEDIPFTTEQVTDKTKYAGYTAVKTAGKNGTKQVTANVTYVDGAEVAREIVSSTVLKNPVTQVNVVGTGMPITSAQTGAASGFIWPVQVVKGENITGWIGSYPGHTGMDIACPSGTPIFASAAGVVTYAAQSGPYGKHIVISHGNGIETWYAHASVLMVTVGQKVNQGQQIGGVGRTGNATGNHLHFEIRINGQYMDARKYVKMP